MDYAQRRWMQFIAPLHHPKGESTVCNAEQQSERDGVVR